MLFGSMYNKTIIRFGFCDIQNNKGLGKDNPYLDLDYSGYHKSLIQQFFIIIHQTHYEKSDWSKAFNQFTIACELDMINVIYHVKFNVCLVTKPLGVFSSETKWLNASLLFLR